MFAAQFLTLRSSTLQGHQRGAPDPRWSGPSPVYLYVRPKMKLMMIIALNVMVIYFVAYIVFFWFISRRYTGAHVMGFPEARSGKELAAATINLFGNIFSAAQFFTLRWSAFQLPSTFPVRSTQAGHVPGDLDVRPKSI